MLSPAFRGGDMPSGSIGFDRAAGYYDETRGFPPGQAGPIAALFCRAGELTPDSRVLEVGTGTGRIALPLAPHVRALFGVDLARPMLDRLCAKRAGEPVHIAQADATRLPFPSSVFDAAVSVHVLHLIGNWQGVLQEVARVLHPDGRLLTGWNDHSRDSEVAVLWKAWEEALGAAVPATIGIPWRQLSTSLVEQGWCQVGGTHTYRYTVTRTLQTFLNRLERRVWSRTWRLSDDMFARGLAAVHDAVQRLGIDAQGPRTVEVAFNVQAYVPPGAG
jgi:SAM-dependent methyltransferase